MHRPTSKSKDSYYSLEKHNGDENMPQISPGNILNNVLKGKLGIASVWDTDPTDLVNMTDGNITTVTGTGTKAILAAGDIGIVTFDLGSIKTVLVGARVGLWRSAGTIYIGVEVSDDNINWIAYMVGTVGLYSQASGAAAEALRQLLTTIVTGRYIRLRVYLNAAGTGNVKIYEVMAWELTI